MNPWEAILRLADVSKQLYATGSPGLCEQSRKIDEATNVLHKTIREGRLCEECGIELGERIGALVVKRD